MPYMKIMFLPLFILPNGSFNDMISVTKVLELPAYFVQDGPISTEAVSIKMCLNKMGHLNKSVFKFRKWVESCRLNLTRPATHRNAY